MNRDLIRMTVDLEGVVQGVGFRPALLRLAEDAGLGGWVQNRSGAVRLALVGTKPDLDDFLDRLPAKLPPHARLDRISKTHEEKIPANRKIPTFKILESNREDAPRAVIPADLAACPDCMAEILDPANRRYGYPFTTCTNCGPRYTVVNAMPYDRERTTLAAFPLCPKCKAEYENPRNRRFHAESIACPVCGPKLSLLDNHAKSVSGDPLKEARRALADGEIVAVRGLGGYLLAVDAFNAESLKVLRQRKNRQHKPLAVMARDISVLRHFCDLPGAAEKLLQSAAAPIVILDAQRFKFFGKKPPLDLLTPDSKTLGAMLPTTPLHKLLFEPLEGDPTPPLDLLVMTSGNRGGEPICIANEEAFERLSGIADKFLVHDREINLRNDDSLCVIREGALQVWRRARGFAPDAVRLHKPLSRCVLAMGAELKNTIAVGAGAEVVLSPHIGDLETPEAVAGLEKAVSCLPGFLNRTPQAVAVDLHPDMHSTRIGVRIAKTAGLPVAYVQHHHAHAASCLAENGAEEGLALVFDGTGYGADGAIWGAELLRVFPCGFERLGTFAGVPLPGGDAAVTHPARQAVGRLAQAGVPIPSIWMDKLGITSDEARIWTLQSLRGLNSPTTHAAGRLFDSVASLLDLCPRAITYEGQAAIRLEAAARQWDGRTALPELPFLMFEKSDMIVIDWSETFRLLARQSEATIPKSATAMGLHRAVAKAALAMAHFGLERSGLRTIALSGGVFMNRILTETLSADLREQRFEVLTHRRVPPNDGGISFGQAVIAGGL